jgi:hypothetical protein
VAGGWKTFGVMIAVIVGFNLLAYFFSDRIALASRSRMLFGSNLQSGEIPDQILDLQDTIVVLFLGGIGCLVTQNPTLEAWLTSLDPTWNEGWGG